MTGQHTDDLPDDTTYRVRCMRSLKTQLQEDHSGLNLLWQRLKRGKADKPEIEEIVRVLSWLKEGLREFKELRARGIEGVLWGEIDGIEKDVVDKENELRIFLFSISKETENLPNKACSRS